MIVGQGRSEECGAAFFRAFRKAPHDKKTLLVGALRKQLRPGPFQSGDDGAIETPAVIKADKAQ